jgi:hypothetical protein
MRQLTLVNTFPLVSVAALTLGGCSLFEVDDSYNPAVDPADFITVIDNPFFPLQPGSVRRYRETGDEGKLDIVVTVMPETKVIAGVTTTVVHDVVSRDGEVLEDTWDWYAQDRAGNVWYFGEDTKEYDRGRVSSEGSWETGVRGAKPGIIMPAKPKTGWMSRQEYLVGEAEDEGQIIGLNETVTVAAGKFTGCVKTKEWTRIEPGILEHKYYAPGIGVVAEVTVEGGTSHGELVSFTK